MSLRAFCLVLASVGSAVVVLGSGCATGTGADTGGSGGGTTTPSTGGSGGGTGGSGGQGDGGALFGGGGHGGGAPPAPPIVYMHTNTTLFQGDPSAPDLAAQKVGDFDCIGTGAGQDTSMTDIAVSSDGVLWGISKSNAWQLEVADGVVHCVKSIPLQNPADIRFYGLAFAPKGLLDPNKEVLIAGNTAGELWSVSESGALTQHGTFGTVPTTDGNGHSYPYAGKKWELSGDIVFLENAGTPVGFATLRDCPNPPDSTNCNDIDTLVELNVPMLATATTQSITKSIRGQIVTKAGCSDAVAGYGAVYGITAWKSQVFGFARAPNSGGGLAIGINNDDGTACLLKQFPNDYWAGAGITTSAEVDIPPPK